MTNGADAPPFTDSRMVLRSLATDHRVVDESGGSSVVANAWSTRSAIASNARSASIRVQLRYVFAGWINSQSPRLTGGRVTYRLKSRHQDASGVPQMARRFQRFEERSVQSCIKCCRQMQHRKLQIACPASLWDGESQPPFLQRHLNPIGDETYRVIPAGQDEQLEQLL